MATWSLVGRTDELSRLVAAATGGTGRGLILSGPPGIGKSRLLRECLTLLEPDLVAVCTAVANATTATLPLGALAQALPAAVPADLPPTALLRWAADALREQAGGRPLVLVVDDAHLLDPVSAALVQQSARVDGARVLAAVRTGRTTPDPIGALLRDDLVDRLDLAALGLADCTEIVLQQLGAPVDIATADRLWRLSEGNPLQLREIVTAIRADEGFTRSYGVCRWTRRLAPTPALDDIVDRRLGELDHAERQVLETVALGEPLELRILLDAVDPLAVERLEERDLVLITRRDRRTTVSLAHPLDGLVVRARCPVTRTHRLLGQLADRVAAAGGRRAEDLLRVAAWRLDADAGVDAATLLAASHSAIGRCDLALALRLARGAVEAGGPRPPSAAPGGTDPPGADATGDAAVALLATLLLMSGSPRQAGAALDAGTRADGARTPARLAAAAAVAYWGFGEPEPATALAASADGLRGADAALLRADAALMHLYRGDLAEAERLSTAVAGEPAARPGSRAAAAVVRSHLDAWRGRSQHAARALEDLVGAAYRAPGGTPWPQELPHVRLAAEVARGTALLLAGDLAAVDELAGGEYATLAEAGDLRAASGYLTMLRGQAARLRGHLPEAMRLHRLACAALGHGRVFAAVAHAELAHAAALGGDHVLAGRALARCERSVALPGTLFAPWLEQARYWVAACGGDVRTGVEGAQRLALRARADNLPALELLALYDVARLGQPAPVAERVQALAGQVEGPLAEATAAHVRAMVRDDPGALIAAAQLLAGRDLHLYAAEAAAGAVCRLRAHRSGQLTEAAALMHRELAACPGATTPALRVRLPSLTERERQVARLAAVGVSSKEIAGQLFLSARTVDNHLLRVYAKLGIGGRTELLAALRALGDRH